MKPNQFKRDPYDFQDNPRQGWKDTAEFIKQTRKAKKPTNSMHDRLTQLELKMKEAKQ